MVSIGVACWKTKTIRQDLVKEGVIGKFATENITDIEYFLWVAEENSTSDNGFVKVSKYLSNKYLML